MREQIKKALSSALNVPLDQIPDDASIETFAPWDSVGHVLLVMELELAFGVTIMTNKVQELTSIESILAFLQAEVRP